MDWAYALVIVVMVAWSLQMVFEHFRKVDRIREDIREAVASQVQVTQEAEEAEAGLKEIQEKLKLLGVRAEELGKQERDLQEQVFDLKRKHAR